MRLVLTVFGLVLSIAPVARALPCTTVADCGATAAFCVDGVCCATACAGGTTDCQACAGSLTGLADGVCAPILGGTICRAAAGACDLPESCDGASTVCPGDALSNALCRGNAGPCDVEERCTGSSAACPPDVVRSAGTVCFPGGSVCDIDDVCDGIGPGCAPAFAPADTECAPAAGVCDLPDLCAGTSGDCVPRFAVDDVCRPSAGPCDTAEVCSGASAMCPVDLHLPAGIVCRDTTDPSCNPAEVCLDDGTCAPDVNTCAPGDGGVGVDAGGMSDAGAGTDGGAGSSSTGCACRAGRGRVGLALPLVALLGLVATLRARRACAPRARPCAPR